MTPLTSSQKKYLRGLAHPLNPIVQVGKAGLSPTLHGQLDQALNDHELVKIKFNEFKEERKEMAAMLAQHSQSEVVGIVGHVAIIYRSHPQPEKRRIVMPGSPKKAAS